MINRMLHEIECKKSATKLNLHLQIITLAYAIVGFPPGKSTFSSLLLNCLVPLTQFAANLPVCDD